MIRQVQVGGNKDHAEQEKDNEVEDGLLDGRQHEEGHGDRVLHQLVSGFRERHGGDLCSKAGRSSVCRGTCGIAGGRIGLPGMRGMQQRRSRLTWKYFKRTHLTMDMKTMVLVVGGQVGILCLGCARVIPRGRC